MSDRKLRLDEKWITFSCDKTATAVNEKRKRTQKKKTFTHPTVEKFVFSEDESKRFVTIYISTLEFPVFSIMPVISQCSVSLTHELH